MLSKEEFLRLLEKFISGDINYEEHTTLFDCIRSNEYDDLLAEHMQTSFDKPLGVCEGIPAYRSQEIIRKITSSQKQISVLKPLTSVRVKILRWSAAAVFLGLLACISYFYFLNEEHSSPQTQTMSQSASALLEPGHLQKENETKDPLTIELKDGSIIVLKPGSTLKYPRHFSSDKREVYLDGEAFFQVTKNVKRPFFVYSKKLVTHVIGTSFTIKTDTKNNQIEVSVRTGKVEVYEKRRQENDKKKNNGVILLPNQKVVYHENNGQFIASLVDEPLPVPNNNSSEETDDIQLSDATAPLSEVLHSLENIYGIEMIVENENLYKCLVTGTGDMKAQSLYTKLDIICKTINASYELVGTKIIVRGKGCE
jgi:transmembrane sensor